MKKRNLFKLSNQTLGLLIVILSAFSCQKEEVNPLLNDQKQQTDISVDIASTVALNFTKTGTFFASSQQKDSSLESVKKSSISGYEGKYIEKIITIADENNSPALYVVTFKPMGFIIISATRKESPILAYSENNKFDEDNSSIGLSDWISTRKKRIQNLKNDPNYEVPFSVKEEWLSIAPPSGGGGGEIVISGGKVYEQVGPLFQTTWGQGERYNDLLNNYGCNNYTNGRPPTGCVATAMAQVMRYWKYPSTYNWSIMPNYADKYTSSSSGTVEIARLMKDAGSAVGMAYTCTGSGAYLSDAQHALINTFGYSSYASIIDFNSQTIESYFLPQFNAKLPVIMQGVDAIYGGHAWVCDGYKRTVSAKIHNPGTVYEYKTYTISGFYLSMNWGWNGNSNGWFLYTNFNPSIYNFSSSQKCIINIHP